MNIIFIISQMILTTLAMTKTKVGDTQAPDLFANLDPKEVPLYICKESGNPIKWKLPSELDCCPVDTTLPTSIVNITLWFEDKIPITIPIYECYSEIVYTRITVHWNFEIMKKKWTEVNKITLAHCIKLATNREDPEGNKMHKLGDYLFGTRKLPKPTKKYMACTTSSTKNYYLATSQATVENDKWTVNTDLNLKKPCSYKQGKCKSKRGITFWNSDSKICTMKKGISTTCIVTGSRISCREESLSLNLINPARRCGMKIGATKEGILFTQDNLYGENGLNLGTTPTSVFAKECVGNSFSGANRSAYNFDKFWLTYHALKENSSLAIQHAHESTCEMNSLWYQSTRFLARHAASVSDHFNMLGGKKDDKHLAFMNGRVLSIYKCSTIYEYQMLKRGSECIREWPVAYIFENVRKTGYVRGMSHEIVDLPSENECHDLEFYFNSGKHMYLLNDNTVVTDMPVLPMFVRREDVKDFFVSVGV